MSVNVAVDDSLGCNGGSQSIPIFFTLSYFLAMCLRPRIERGKEEAQVILLLGFWFVPVNLSDGW